MHDKLAASTLRQQGRSNNEHKSRGSRPGFDVVGQTAKLRQDNATVVPYASGSSIGPSHAAPGSALPGGLTTGVFSAVSTGKTEIQKGRP
eukprot:2620429-Amphidinium_carterae.1